jgi:hypothetical protein
MSQKFKIIGVTTDHYPDFTCFAGFQLEGVIGSVDPFISGYFDGPAKDLELHSETLAWARAQVGKYLVCDEVMTRAFATHGNTYICEPELEKAQ